MQQLLSEALLEGATAQAADTDLLLLLVVAVHHVVLLLLLLLLLSSIPLASLEAASPAAAGKRCG
jgi:hypothetical protein